MWAEIQAQVHRCLAASRFREDLGMDETDLFGPVIRLGNPCRLRLSDAELSAIATVRQLVECPARRFAAGHRYAGRLPGGSVFPPN